MQKQLGCEGAEPIGSTPEHYAAYLQQDVQKWGKLIREGGIRAQ